MPRLHPARLPAEEKTRLRTTEETRPYERCVLHLDLCPPHFRCEAWNTTCLDCATTMPRVAAPYPSGRLFAVFSGADLGVETEKLGYYVLSVLWRSGVHKWKIAGKTTSTNLGTYAEPIRRYLLGASGFPSDTVVNAAVCTDFGSQGISYVPAPVPKNPFTTFALLTRGIYYRVLMGRSLPAEIREICCVTGPLFLADCESQTLPAFDRLQRTAKVAENLRRL